MRRERDAFFEGINMYVPAMQYVHDVVHKGVFECSLGTPTGLDADGINNDADGDGAADLTIYSADFSAGAGGIGRETDARYGQSVILTPSGDPGAGGIDVVVYGEDYLGQPMGQTLTVANGATAAVESTKAFKRVTHHKLTNPATNAITFDLGWGNRLGIPYKMGQIIGGSEGGVEVFPQGQVIGDAESFTTADATTSTHTSPIDGYFVGMRGRYTTAMTGAASIITAALAGSDYNAGDWVSPVAAVGDQVGFTLDKADWGAVTRGQSIVWTSDGAGTAGVVELSALWSYGQGDLFQAVTTDPQTLTTGDPRGLYDPQLAPNGSREYILRYIADNSVNAAGNGGLHGIKHVVS